MDGENVLILERKKFPPGFACPAGHVEPNETSIEAAARELYEEVGLTAKNLTIIYEGQKNNPCRRKNGTFHNWTIFKVEASGKIKASIDETKGVTWMSKKELQELSMRTKLYNDGSIDEKLWKESPGLEPVWDEFFKELKIL